MTQQQDAGKAKAEEHNHYHGNYAANRRRTEIAGRGCELGRRFWRVPLAATVLQAFAKQFVELLVVHIYA